MMIPSATPPELPPAMPPLPRTSLAARLMNILAAPSDVFDEVKSAPMSAANWLVPIACYSLVGILSAIVTFSQPAVVQQIQDQQRSAVQAQVAAGKMTQEQADKAAEVMEKFSMPAFLIAAGGISVVFAGFAGVFWWGLILWLISRFALKTELDFMKTIEIVGLAGMISVLELVVKALIIVALGNSMVTPSLGLLVKNPDPKNPIFILLSIINPFTFWILMVRALGLARLTGIAFARSAAWVFAAWGIITVLAVSCAIAFQKLYGG